MTSYQAFHTTTAQSTSNMEGNDSDVESIYSGISNEDFEEPDGEPLSAHDEQSDYDIEEGAFNAENVQSVSDAEEVSSADVEESFPASDVDCVPTDDESVSRESEIAAGERSPSTYVEEESIKEESGDAEPTTDIDDYLEESTYYPPVEIKEESCGGSDAEQLPSTGDEVSGLGEDILREAEDSGRCGKLLLNKQCERIKSSVKRVQKSKKTKKTRKMPPPYTGPRVIDEALHCYYCQYSHKYKSRLVRHMEKHLGRKHFCPVCRKALASRSVKPHMMTHTAEKPFKCHLCDYAGKKGHAFKQHLERHKKWALQKHSLYGTELTADERALFDALTEPVHNWVNQASLEGKVSLTAKSRLEKKAKAVEKFPPPYAGPRLPGKFHCYYCPKAYDSKTKVRCHIENTYLPCQFFCTVCGFGFSTWARLLGHRKVHTTKLLSCLLCDFKTKYEQGLSSHMAAMHGPKLNNKNNKLLQCFHCGWTSKFKCRLIDHMLSHKPKTHQCALCEYKTTSHRNLRIHRSKAHSEKRLKCTFCDFETKHKNALASHMRTHTNEKVPCNLCSYEFASPQALRAHMKLHGDAFNFECHLCSYTTIGVCSFSNHLKLQHAELAEYKGATGEELYACQMCYTVCNTVGHLLEHLNTHRRDRRFQCPHCPYISFDKSTLSAHVDVKHAIAPVKYSCTACDFKTCYKYSLKKHVNHRHTRTIWYKCRFCNFQSLIGQNVASHERRHCGDKKYACDFCNYRSYDSELLKNHSLRHTGERPFSCDLCDFTDFTKSGILRHKQGVHATDRPYKCNFCDKSFKTRQTAKFHEECHTGKTYYHCSKCSYKSVVKGCVDKHMSRMHPLVRKHENLPDTFPNGRKKRWYFCDKCAFKTCNKPTLLRHMKIYHPNRNRFGRHERSQKTMLTPYHITIKTDDLNENGTIDQTCS